MTDETVIYGDAESSIYTTNKGLIGRLKRANVTLKKENELGAWFDLTECKIIFEVPKQRGRGLKRLEIT